MVWLFGQIWLWLLIAFALGAGLTALVLTGTRRQPRGEQPGQQGQRGQARPPATAEIAAEEPAPAPPPANPPVAAEETLQIPAPAEYVDDTDTRPPDQGHTEGILPSRHEWHVRNEWPDEQDIAEEDDRRPHRGG